MTRMAVRVMVYEESADQIFTFDKRTDDVDLFVESNADVRPATIVPDLNLGDRKGEGAEPFHQVPSESLMLLSDQLEKTGPCLGDPYLEYMRSQPDPNRRKLANFYGAISANVRDDNFQNMVHDEYLAQLAYDSSTELQLFELSAIVKSVHKSNYPLSGEPGCVIGVMVTHYNRPEENNKGVLFRTMLKSNFPGISRPR